MMKRGRTGKGQQRDRPYVKKRIAEAAAALAVSKVAQRSRARGQGVANASVFQTVRAGPEFKFIDVHQSINVAAATATGTLSALINPCAQGTDANQHIGRQTTMTSLYWAWYGGIPANTTDGGSLRLVIVYDKEAEGAAPTIATGTQTDIFNGDTIGAKMNLNNRDRFVVVADEIIECLGSAGPQSFHRKGYRKIKLPCVFNASALGTIAAINTGSLYAVVWQDGDISTAGPVTTLDTRIRFVDN